MDDVAPPNGLDRVRAYLTGGPVGIGMARLLNARLVSAESGAVVFAAEPDERHTNPIGTVHGGWITTLLDSALGCAANTTLPPGKLTTTLELKVSFLRACVPDGRTVTARASVDRAGRRVVFTQARLEDADGALLATATSTLMVVDG